MTTATLPNRTTNRSTMIAVVVAAAVAIAAMAALIIGLTDTTGETPVRTNTMPAEQTSNPGTPDALERRLSASRQVPYPSPNAIDRRQAPAATATGSLTYRSADAVERRTAR